MARPAPRVFAWAAWLSLLSVPTIADPVSPPSSALDVQVETLVREATDAMGQGQMARAEEIFGRALAAQDELGRADMHTARILARLGEASMRLGKTDQAQRHLDRAFALVQATAPESTEMADVMNLNARAARRRDDPEQAQAHLDRAFALLQVAEPEGAVMADVLNNMGLVALDRFELDRAQEYFHRSVALYEKIRPGGIEVAQPLHNLGSANEYGGDLAAAERLYRRSLAVAEKLGPSGLETAHTLNNLASVAAARGDLASAESYSRRSLALLETLIPDSVGLATSLANLGTILRRRGDFKAAEPLLRRALAIHERRAGPDSLVFAGGLRQLGSLARDRGDLKRAESLVRQALAIETRRRPDGMRVSNSLRELGELALAQGHGDEAEQHLAGALSIAERLLPGSIREGRIRYFRGCLLRQRGHLSEAAEEMRRAIDAFELHVGRLGGLNEDRAGYRARRGAYYTDLVEVLLQLRDAPQAFHVLERSRARGFLEMMATRDLAAAEHVPATLEAERRRLAGQYDRVQKRLSEQDGRSASDVVAKLQDELRTLRRRHGELVEEIRRGAAGASLRYPEPFDLAATQAALEPGSLLLSYAVGDESTHVFAVSREEGLTVATLSMGRAALQRDVELFRRLIQEAAPGTPRVAQLANVGHRLYEVLIAPVAPRIERCRRVVIVPDGPLHVLPFAALVRERKGPRHYFVEWKPISTALSATVYGELRQRASAAVASDDVGAFPTLVAFGDPALRGSSSRGEDTSDRERSLLKQVAGLRPLPAARREVDRIATLFKGSVEVLVGPRATEERAKGLPARVRYVHFATHTVFDDTSPMETALVLAAPEDAFAKRTVQGDRRGIHSRGAEDAAGDRENGLLQAWEILEQLQLDADLVVLSTCDSGLGRNLRGEGLWGLVRAFQYAGARSVVASLWRVSDQVTAVLMVRFYRYLRKGLAKDEALRAAQVDLIGGRVEVRDGSGRAARRDVSAPHYWAAFQLHGDGR